VILKPGRHLEYEVEPGAQAVEELSYVTVIRFTPDAPKGKATALLSWRGAAVEVCVCVCGMCGECY